MAKWEDLIRAAYLDQAELRKMVGMPQPGDKVTVRVPVSDHPMIVDELKLYRPQQETTRRRMGEEWDVSSAGVRLPPIEPGTLVEAHSLMREMTELGVVMSRTRHSSGAIVYEVRTEEYGVNDYTREHLAVVDLSTPEAVEEFLNANSQEWTAEEVARFLEGEGDA